MIRQNQKLINYMQMTVDMFLYILCFYLAFVFNLKTFSQMNIDRNVLLITLFLAIATDILSYNIFGLYKSHRSIGFSHEFYSIVKANLLNFAILCVCAYVFSQFYIFPIISLFFTNTLISIVYRYMLRRLLRSFRRKGYNKKYILIIGTNKSTHQFVERINSSRQLGYEIIGYIDSAENEGFKTSIKYVGGFDGIDSYVSETLIDEIIIMLDDYSTNLYKDIIERCEYWGIKFSLIPSFFSDFGDRLFINSFNGLPVFNIRQVPLDDQLNLFLKRLSDIVMSSVFILVFSPLMFVVALLIKISTKGKIIFTQERVGTNRKHFNIYKFCSMRTETEHTAKFATKNDDRCTPIGRFIRKYSIDELPQLFNVLKGEMSIVGPRPEIPHFVEEFQEEIPLYMVKHYIKPGMTGWAQVSGFRGDTSIAKRIECDIYYIEHWSLWFDIKILVLTAFKGILSKNAY